MTYLTFKQVKIKLSSKRKKKQVKIKTKQEKETKAWGCYCNFDIINEGVYKHRKYYQDSVFLVSPTLSTHSAPNTPPPLLYDFQSLQYKKFLPLLFYTLLTTIKFLLFLVGLDFLCFTFCNNGGNNYSLGSVEKKTKLLYSSKPPLFWVFLRLCSCFHCCGVRGRWHAFCLQGFIRVLLLSLSFLICIFVWPYIRIPVCCYVYMCTGLNARQY